MATSPTSTTAMAGRPMAGCSKISARGTAAINTSAIPARVPSMPARGRWRLSQGPAREPATSMRPPKHAAARPTRHASNPSPVTLWTGPMTPNR
jgi:hypothetical protein